MAINAWDDYIARVRHAETLRWLARHAPHAIVRSSDGIPAGVIAPGSDGYLLAIPRIGVLDVVHMLEPAALTGVPTPVLSRYGLGQVPLTAALGNVSPGDDGTAVIAGHRTTHGAPFRHLDLLKPGDVIVLRKGAAFQRWQIDATAIIAPTDLDAIRSRHGVRRLVLLSCTPPFSARARLMIDARPAPRDAMSAHTDR